MIRPDARQLHEPEEGAHEQGAHGEDRLPAVARRALTPFPRFAASQTRPQHIECEAAERAEVSGW